MSKFLNISTDSTLGGSTPSDELVVSQKAIRAALDTKAPLDTFLAPNFDGLTPIATYEFDTSSTSFYKLLTFNNIYAATEDIPIARALFRITATCLGRTSIINAIVETQRALTYMRVLSNHTTGYTASSNTGVRYMRTAVPKALNNGNDWELDISTYNATARHIKVEVFQSDNGFTWFADGSISTITTSTHSSTTISYYTTQGTIIYPIINTTVSNASTATYLAGRLSKWLQGTPLAAEALLPYQICFLSGNNIYPSTNTSVAINTDVGLMSTYSSGINAGAAPAYYNINQKEPISDLDAIPHATLTRGDPCYFRCTMDANGNIKSDNYVATEMTPGYTWCYVGIAGSATGISFDSTNSVFLTLDLNGDLTHVNGKKLADGGGGGGSSGSAQSVGNVFWTMRTDNELNGAVECNGATYDTGDFTGSGSIGILLAAGRVPYVSLAQYATLLSSQGSCGVFGWDGGSTTEFRVPSLNDIFVETGTAAQIGDYIAPGVPNITGGFNSQTGRQNVGSVSGAFNRGDVGTGYHGGSSQGNFAGNVSFDASRSSSVYKNDVTTVQPNTIRFRAMVQLATGATDEALETCTGVLADVAGLKDMNNITAVGKETIANLAMPSDRYSNLTVGASGSVYTAPADGWFVAVGSGTGNNMWLELISDIKQGVYGTIGWNYKVSLPVRKGGQCTMSYNNINFDFLRFVYAQGAQ